MNGVTGIIINQDPNTFLSLFREIVEDVLSKFSGKITDVTDEELTTTQAADLLKVTRQTISKYVRDGTLKQYTRGGRPYYKKNEVLASGKVVKKKKKKQKA